MTTGATTPRQVEPRWTELESIVGVSHLRSATEFDTVDDVTPSFVISPASNEEIAEALKWATAAEIAVCVRSGGTKMRWGNPPRRVHLILSMERFSGACEHAWEDMTFTVKAGVTISAVQKDLATHGQRLALDPLWPEHSTIGGVIATNDSGALRLRFGSIRDLLLGVTTVLAGGTIARSGGKVVKNVAGYDLPKLLTGSFGTLGVITEATFRAHPLPQSTRSLSFAFADADQANRFLLAIADAPLVPTGLQLRRQDGSNPIVDLRFEGIPVGIDAQIEKALSLSENAAHSDAPGDCWNARESLWQGSSPAVVGKFSVLPTKIACAANLVRRNFGLAKIVVQSIGIGLFRGETESLEHLSQSIAGLQASLAEIGGTLTLLDLPLELKRQVDVFGPARDAYPLMRRIKQQFDPNATLNPGRFVGGI